MYVNICTNDIDLYNIFADDANICKYIRNGEDQAKLQTTLSKMQNWSDTWLLKLNVQNCKVMSYGRHPDRNYTYTMVMNGQCRALDYETTLRTWGNF